MSDEKQRRQREQEQAEILAAQKELIKRMMSDEKPGPKGLFGDWVRAMEREAGKKSLTPDAARLPPTKIKSTLTDYQRQRATRQPTAYAQRDLSVKSDDTDIEATDVQAEHGGNVYLQSDAASSVHGEESWRETDLGGQRIRQYSRRAEDFTHPTGGQSRITVGGKEVKPGSKQYKEALAALNRGDTIGVEAEAEYKRDAADRLQQMKRNASNPLTTDAINKANGGDK